MNWNSLTSIQNLTLAWRRITTGRNLQYKRFFREGYLVYESALRENIRVLKNRLDNGGWSPSHATRVYLPKPSGLQRPLSFLELEDQIVLQAIGNQFANKLRKKRRQVEDSTVFSNILPQDTKSIYFTEQWQRYYRNFQSRCEILFAFGNYKWVGHFDLAAYYDTISHDLMINSAFPTIEAPVANFLNNCLQTWSANNIEAMTGHGIPQGPVASDFLADGFFLPIDLYMRKISDATIRYVDDIRIFGQTENEVRNVAIKLEQECRHRGLIPQSSKFEVKELNSIEDALGSMPSIPPSDPNAHGSDAMEPDYAHRMLESCLGGSPLKVQDKSRFRYVMYRAPADQRILNRAMMLLSRHPEHIDAFTAFFGNFERRPRIAREAIRVLRSDVPYTYVRGELWHLVARLGNEAELRDALAIARIDAKQRNECAVLSWGVMHFLLKCEQLGIARAGQRLRTEHPISRALLAPQIPAREFAAGRVIPEMLRGSTFEQLAAARALQSTRQTLNSIGLRANQLSTVCQNSLRGLGVIRNRRGAGNRDWIAVHLEELYGCRNDPVWRQFFGTEYEHALQILTEAKVRYSGARSEWLNLQDSFNDAMVKGLIEFLNNRGLPGQRTLIDGRGHFIGYGTLIQAGGPFETNFPALTNHLDTIHRRRNALPGSHPYDKHSRAQNRFLTRPEQRNFHARQRAAVDEIVNFLIANGI